MLLTVDDVTRRAHYRNAYRTLRKLLDLRAVPIVNENDTVATEEIRFGDNDRLAALVAALVARRPAGAALRRGRALDRRPDPTRHSTRIAEVRSDEPTWPGSTIGGAGRAGVGTGGMVTKVEAARIATGFGIPVVLTAAAAGRRRRWPASRSARCSTRQRQRPAARLFWLAHATAPRGRLHLDPGAVPAVVGRRKSLLPAGITAVDGAFTAGDPVDLVDTGGAPVARGPGQLRRGGAARRCSAGPPPNSPRRSARRTNGRSSTATTWCCCEEPRSMSEPP